MKTLLIAALACLTVAAPVQAQDNQKDALRATLFEGADAALAAARDVDAELLAPTSYQRGLKDYGDAERDLERGRNLDRIRTKLARATESFNRAVEAAGIARITLASAIKTRNDAQKAEASRFAATQWADAEQTFYAAASRLEGGDIRGTERRSEDAQERYRDAELTAIKAQYLNQTRALLKEAERKRVERYAPVTINKSRTLLAQAEKELEENRYDTDLPRSLAQQANYEARHAIYLAEHIRDLRDRDQSIEDIILSYEEPLQQIAAAADKVAALDKGTEPVVIELSQYIEDLRDRERVLSQDLSESQTRIAGLEDEIRELDEKLGGVSQERVALAQRLEAEARLKQQFARVENLFGREEARVYREGNDILIRLVGLTFPSGQSNVEPGYGALLAKVRDAIDVFPRAQVVIEGHTDSYGGDEANMALSEKRAESVRDYLITRLAIPSFRLNADGFGETQPIANNETDQGRARNRRIDVRINSDVGASP